MKSLLVTIAVFALTGLIYVPEAAAQSKGLQELEQKLESVDFADPDQLFEVAAWAMRHRDSKVRKRGRSLMKEVLELDPDYEEARKMLGHVKVGDRWFTSKRAAAKAKKELLEKEMNAKGYVWFRGGWIKKSEKRAWNKQWEKGEDDIWISKEEAMRRKGYVLYQGQWLKLSDEDVARMEKHRKMTGDDILIMTTPHFVLHLMVPVEYGEKYAKLVEQIYDWFMKEFDVSPDRARQFWPRRAHIWTFRTTQQFQDWITAYAEEYQLKEEEKKQFRNHPGGWILSGRLLATNVVKKAEDLENPLAHDVGHFLIAWQTLGRAAPWLTEGFANLVEEAHTEIGRVSCSTLSRYGEGGDVAKKDFNTKDGKSRIRGLVKAKEDPRFVDLGKKGLNSLDGDDLSKGYSLVEWLFHNKRGEFIEFLKQLRASPAAQSEDSMLQLTLKAIASAFSGATLDAFENIWRQYVLKKYR